MFNRYNITRQQEAELRPARPGIGNEDIQPVADNGANLSGELVRTVRRGKIRGNSVGAAAAFLISATTVSASFASLA